MQHLDLIAERRDGHAVVRLAGELDVTGAPRLREALMTAIEGGDRHVVVDCSGLEFLDSTGLGVLVAARTRARAAGGSLLLTGAQPPLERLLAVTGVDGLFRLEPPVRPAVAG
jgi:anti-anti-sigma factor